MIFSPVVGRIGPFMKMTYDFRPSCGNLPSCGNRPICGNRPSCEGYTHIYIYKTCLTVSDYDVQKIN